MKVTQMIDSMQNSSDWETPVNLFLEECNNELIKLTEKKTRDINKGVSAITLMTILENQENKSKALQRKLNEVLREDALKSEWFIRVIGKSNPKLVEIYQSYKNNKYAFMFAHKHSIIHLHIEEPKKEIQETKKELEK